MKALCVLLLTCSALGQLPNAPQPKEDKFLDTQHLLLFNSSAMSLAAQAGIDCSPSTASTPQLTHRQCNGQMIAAGGIFALEVMGAGILHLKKRHGWESLVPMIATSYGVGRAAWSSTHRKR